MDFIWSCSCIIYGSLATGKWIRSSSIHIRMHIILWPSRLGRCRSATYATAQQQHQQQQHQEQQQGAEHFMPPTLHHEQCCKVGHIRTS
ncbi:GD24790 [Drosophila simulans]|uniref:GD24790 n=1 Tax=Drosophila simulans TaxID=7240 RepID=B4NUA8_DROSI|nr:GD24790 [Drosophila simulans]